MGQYGRYWLKRIRAKRGVVTRLDRANELMGRLYQGPSNGTGVFTVDEYRAWVNREVLAEVRCLIPELRRFDGVNK